MAGDHHRRAGPNALDVRFCTVISPEDPLEPCDAAPEQPRGGSRQRDLRLAMGFAAVLAVLLLANAVLMAVSERPPTVATIHALPMRLRTPLGEASTDCAAGVLSDHGLTLYVNTAGELPGSGTLALADASCILRALGAPASVLEEIGKAHDTPGVHSAAWTAGGGSLPEGFELDGSFIATWSYEPGSGLDLAVVQHRELDVNIHLLPALQALNIAGQ